MMDRKQVEDLQPGDSVVIDTGYHHLGHQIAEVTKVTATQITLSDGDRYNKRSLIRIGDSEGWTSKRRLVTASYPERGLMTVEEALAHSQKLHEESQARQLAAKITGAHISHLRRLGRERLEQIAALIWPDEGGE